MGDTDSVGKKNSDLSVRLPSTVKGVLESIKKELSVNGTASLPADLRQIVEARGDLSQRTLLEIGAHTLLRLFPKATREEWKVAGLSSLPSRSAGSRLDLVASENAQVLLGRGRVLDMAKGEEVGLIRSSGAWLVTEEASVEDHEQVARIPSPVPILTGISFVDELMGATPAGSTWILRGPFSVFLARDLATRGGGFLGKDMRYGSCGLYQRISGYQIGADESLFKRDPEGLTIIADPLYEASHEQMLAADAVILLTPGDYLTVGLSVLKNKHGSQGFATWKPVLPDGLAAAIHLVRSSERTRSYLLDFLTRWAPLSPLSLDQTLDEIVFEGFAIKEGEGPELKFRATKACPSLKMPERIRRLRARAVWLFIADHPHVLSSALPQSGDPEPSQAIADLLQAGLIIQENIPNSAQSSYFALVDKNPNFDTLALEET